MAVAVDVAVTVTVAVAVAGKKNNDFCVKITTLGSKTS